MNDTYVRKGIQNILETLRRSDDTVPVQVLKNLLAQAERIPTGKKYQSCKEWLDVYREDPLNDQRGTVFPVVEATWEASREEVS